MRNAGYGLLITGLMLATSITSADQVLYSFEGGSEGWGAFGPLTTDSGVNANGAVGDGRYHVGDFDLAGWGMVDISPAVDLSGRTGLRLFARLSDVEGFTPFSGTAVMRMGLGIGDAEWLADFDLTSDYTAYEVSFDQLVPDGVFATAPITTAQLSDPGLFIKLVIPEGGNSGTGVFNYDQVTAVGGDGTTQIAPGAVIYDFTDPNLNTCYPDDWTFFGYPQTDFGLDGDAEDGEGAFQAADWTGCDLSGLPQCAWVGSAIGIGVFTHPHCIAGGTDNANLDLSLGTGITIRVKNNLEVSFGGTIGARVTLEMVDADGTQAVTPRNVLQNPAVVRAPMLSDDWETLTFWFDGLDSAFDNDSAISGAVPGLDLANITQIKLLWRRYDGDGVNVFEFDQITLINDPPVSWADADLDGDVDCHDLAERQVCAGALVEGACATFDADDDGDIDGDDFAVWADVMIGPDVTTDFYPWAY